MARALIISILFASQFTFAQNPQITRCHQSDGQFIVADLYWHGQNDQVSFCKFGLSTVGALDVMNFVDSQKNSVAQAFADYSNGITTCAGEVVTARLVNTSTQMNVCVYSDNSMIDIATIISGKEAAQNQLFNSFLGL